MKSLLIFSALATASTIASAQVKTAKPDSTCTKYSDGRTECRVYRYFGPDSLMRRFSYRMDSVMEKRAALGLEVRTTGSRRDTLGVFVEAVTPKGPAENAGIVEGDRIAAINGVDLRTAAADLDDDDYFGGAPGPRRLSREVQKLTPGSRVTLRVYSGGRVRDVQVTAGKASELNHFRTAARFRGGRFEFDGPENMIIGPEMPMMFREDFEPMLRERLRDIEPMVRERLQEIEPMLRERLQDVGPLLRERLRDLPERIELRSQPRIRTIRAFPRTYRVDRGAEEWRAGSDWGFIH